jgi:uncharacterized protein involved in exopolysaccharide biosynthesis
MKQNTKEEILNDEEGVTVYTLFSKIYAHIKYLKSKWRILLVVFIVGGGLGIWYSFVKKPLYTALISFTVDDSGESQSALSGLASQLGVLMGGGKQSIFEGYNIISFFQSRLMVQKTLLTEVQFDKGRDLLVNRYIEYNHLRKSWKNDPKLKNLTFKPNEALSRAQDSVLFFFFQDIIYNHLNVDRADKRLTILQLKVTSPDELFSKFFAEALAKNVIEFYTNTRIEKTLHNIKTLQHQTDSVRARLNSSLTGVASSIDDVPNANPLKKVLQVSSQNKTVDAEIDRSALLALASNLQGAKMSLNQETPLIDFIDTPILPLQVSKWGKIKGFLVGSVLGLVLCSCILTLTRKTY